MRYYDYLHQDFDAALILSYSSWFKIDGKWEKLDEMVDRRDHYLTFCGGGEPGQLCQFKDHYVERVTKSRTERAF